MCVGAVTFELEHVDMCLRASDLEIMVVNWPSGLRRQFKALV